MNEIIDIVIEDGIELIKGINVTIYDDFIDFNVYFNEEIECDNEITSIEE